MMDGKVVRPSTVRQVIALHCDTRRKIHVTQAIAIKWKRVHSGVGVRHVAGDIVKCSVHVLNTRTHKTEYHTYKN